MPKSNKYTKPVEFNSFGDSLILPESPRSMAPRNRKRTKEAEQDSPSSEQELMVKTDQATLINPNDTDSSETKFPSESPLVRPNEAEARYTSGRRYPRRSTVVLQDPFGGSYEEPCETTEMDDSQKFVTQDEALHATEMMESNSTEGPGGSLVPTSSSKETILAEIDQPASALLKDPVSHESNDLAVAPIVSSPPRKRRAPQAFSPVREPECLSPSRTAKKPKLASTELSRPPESSKVEDAQREEPSEELSSDDVAKKELYVKNAAHYVASQTTHVEELAYHVYGELPGLEEVPMKPPEDFDESMFPQESNVIWTYESVNRIVRADFTPVNDPIPLKDLMYFAKLMQRDDLVVISIGLTMAIENVDKLQLFLNNLGRSKRTFHKYRRFQRRENSHEYDEIDGYVAMSLGTFVAYLESRRVGDSTATVTFDYLGRTITVGVHDVLLYMIDADVPQLFRWLEQEYQQELRWGALYPGGKLCMMRDLPRQMQPFMGPNLYVTPGSTYTSLHQDGLGTVDSGHSCLYGNNEVFMLRRLPEIHKQKACSMVPTKETDSLTALVVSDNTMYRLPHDDGRQDKQLWPTNQVVEEWRKLK